MNSKPYSQYDNLGEYTRTVGMFCSLLFRNGFCKPEQIDQILSSSQIFRSIEQKHNPLLATSNEQVWMALLLEEPSFSALFDDEARQKLLKLNETDELQFDWLSMWSGDVIAQLAMYYDVPMSEIVSSMQFEEFLKFSVANHTQAEERMYAIFAEHSDGKFPLLHSWAANTLDGEICLVDGELANRLVQCLGISDLYANGEYAIGSNGIGTRDLLGCLGAIDINDAGADVAFAKFDENPSIANCEPEGKCPSGEFDVLQIPNTMGAWNKYKMWIMRADDEHDRAKYLKHMTHSIWLVRKSWAEKHKTSSSEMFVTPAELKRCAARMAFSAMAFSAVPMRPGSAAPKPKIKGTPPPHLSGSNDTN